MLTADQFHRSGDSLQFQCEQDLLRKLSELDNPVPGRTRGRSSHQRERFAIVRFLELVTKDTLLTTLSGSAVSFPFKLGKQDGPDFVLRFPGSRTVGIEIVEVATAAHQKALTKLETMPPGTGLIGEDYLVAPGQRLNPSKIRPRVDRVEEAALAEQVLEKVKLKTARLALGYSQADSMHLLLRSLSHSSVPDLRTAVPELQAGLARFKSSSAFSAHFQFYHLLRDSELLFDWSGEPRRVCRWVTSHDGSVPA